MFEIDRPRPAAAIAPRVVKAQLLALLILTVLAVPGLPTPSGATDAPGPDAYGYRSESVPNDLRDISSSGTALSLSDDSVSAPIALPFDFPFYGETKTEVSVSSNGFLTFSPSGNSGCCSGGALPAVDGIQDVIAGYWEDINPNSGGTIRHQTLGSAPDREFVVGFYAVPHFFAGAAVTFEMILHEGGQIELQYGDAPSDGGTHSTGIENSDGTIGLQIAFGNYSLSNQGFLLDFQDRIVLTTSTNVPLGSSIALGAQFTRFEDPTSGEVTLSLFAPDDLLCAGTPLATTTSTVTGNDLVTLDYTPQAAGTHRWLVEYSGDASHDPQTIGCDTATTLVYGDQFAYGAEEVDDRLSSFDPYDPVPSLAPIGAESNGAGINAAGDFGPDGLLYELDTAGTLRISTINGEVVDTATLPAGNYRGMSWDDQAQVMYVFEDTTDTLLSLDLDAVSLAPIGTAPGTTITAIAVDDQGVLYAVDEDADELGTLSTTDGTWTTVGPLGVDVAFDQGLDFDPTAGDLVFAALNGGTVAESRTIDRATGQSTLIGEIGDSGSAQISWLAIDPGTVSVDAGDPQTIELGDATTLIPAGTDPLGQTLSFDWDLDGDGTYESPGAPTDGSITFDSTSAYVNAGPNTVGVRVTNEIDRSATDTTTIAVTTDPTIIAGGPYTINFGETVLLTATGNDDDIGDGTLTFDWDLDGDGLYDTSGDTIVYDSAAAYSAPGANVVTVQGTDDESQSGIDATTVTVLTPPTVSAGGPYETVIGTPVRLEATGVDPDGGDITYGWDLDGDGEFETPGNPVNVTPDVVGSRDLSVRGIDDEGEIVTATTSLVTRPVSLRVGDDDDPIAGAVDISRTRFMTAPGSTFAQEPTVEDLPLQATHAVVARADLFADALTGAVLTGDAPLLFTDSAELDARTGEELQRVVAKGSPIYVLGGTAAVSESVERDIEGFGYEVRRLAGASRVETAIAVATAAEDLYGAAGQTLIARGYAADDRSTAAWVDAVTVGAFAAETTSPVLLTGTETLHPATAQWLETHRDDVVVHAIGGPMALSDQVVEAAGASRIAGGNRFATAVAISEELWADRAGYSIANGSAEDGWAYILAAAGISSDLNQPTLLVEADRVPEETEAMRCTPGSPEAITIVGTERLVSDAVAGAVTGDC